MIIKRNKRKHFKRLIGARDAGLFRDSGADGLDFEELNLDLDDLDFDDVDFGRTDIEDIELDVDDYVSNPDCLNKLRNRFDDSVRRYQRQILLRELLK